MGWCAFSDNSIVSSTEMAGNGNRHIILIGVLNAKLATLLFLFFLIYFP